MELSYKQYSELMDQLVAEGYNVLEASEMIFGYLDEEPKIPINSLNTPSIPRRRGAVGYRNRIGSLSPSARLTASSRPPGTSPATPIARSANTPAPSGGYGGTAGASKPTTAFSPTSTPTDTSKAYSTPAPSGGYGGTAGASKPTTAFSPTSTADAAKSSAMDQWRAANPRLAEVERLRAQQKAAGKSTFDKEFRDKNINPVMYNKTSSIPNSGRSVEDSKKMFPDTPKPAPTQTSTATAFSPSTPALGTSTPAMQSAGTAAASKPVTNQTKTAFSNPSLLSQTTAAEKPEPKKAATPPSRMPLKNSHIITGYLVREGYISEKKDLPGNQEKIDANKNGKIDANDFELLRASKKVAKTVLGSEPKNVGKMKKV